MNAHPYLVFGIFVAVIVFFFVAFAVAAFIAMRWLNRSDSPNAVKLRHLIGGRAQRRDAGEKSFYWTGEDVAARRDSAKKFAAMRGAAYEQSVPALVPRLASFGIVIHHADATVEDAIVWKDGDHRVTVATYTWRDSEGVYHDSVMLVDAPEARLPQFRIRNETLIQKGLGAGHDIDFAEDPKFSEWFHLEGTDERSVRALFGRGVRAEFVNVGHCKAECASSTLLFMDTQQMTVKGFEMFVDDSLRLARRLIGAERG